MKLIAFDTETRPIGPGQVAPRIVCGSFAQHAPGGDVDTALLCHADGLRDAIEDLLLAAIAGEVRLLTHNGGFDYACVCATWPDLIPLVFEALASGNCTDTLWREKLLNLSTTGRLDHVVLPDGSRMEIRYGLADLELAYLGRDRSDQKEDPESWRSHFDTFDGWTGAEMQEHAPEAYAYASADAEGTLRVHGGQEDRKAANRIASTVTEEFQLYSSFCLYLETAWGMATNPAAVAEMRVQVERVLNRNKDLLVASGVLRPGNGAVPHKRQMPQALECLRDMGIEAVTETEFFEDFDWAPHQARLQELGIKFKAPIEESICEAELQRVAAAAYLRIGAIPSMTDGRVGKDGVKVPQIQLGDEQTEFLAAHDPVIAQYHVRKSLRKLSTNQLPILESAPVVHFKYDALKETTRTSSSGNRKGKPALYPAANGQQVPKAIEGGDLVVDPRSGYRPRDGTVFFDVDLHCLELACVGQITHDIFGHSVHLDRYNAGYDLHSYLACQILARSTLAPGPEQDIQQALEGLSPDGQYALFLQFKKCGDAGLEKAFKTYRDLAKPIGLGFPGGIGPVKMVTLARVAYGVQLTEDRARELREMWRDTYPEMPLYFDWISSQRDYHNDGPVDLETGKAEALYWYITPMGAVRRGCTYCSQANGKAMQSPGAEVAKAGNNAVVRACYDPSKGSVLYGARPIAFVHDQVIGETTLDAGAWHDQAMEVSRLMIEAARVALPKVRMRTEPLLTRVWSKSAEPVFGEDGRLVPWEPKGK